MVYSGWKLTLFLVLSCMTSNLMCLTFTTLCLNSLLRIVTIFVLLEKQYNTQKPHVHPRETLLPLMYFAIGSWFRYIK